MRTIQESIEDTLKSVNIWHKHINDNYENLKAMGLNFRFLEIDYAIKCIAEKNYLQSKQHFYTASLLDVFRIINFNDTQLSFGLPYTVYPILSDNEELIQRYSKLRYKPWGQMPGMDENVLKGKGDIWCNTVQFFMTNDIEGIERNLNILETKTVKKKPKNQQGLLIDFEFFKALYSEDKTKMEEILEVIVSPKFHKKRCFNDIHRQYVSLIGLGYAKLSWRKGIEVETSIPLITRELLPIDPLEHYEIPYNFLK